MLHYSERVTHIYAFLCESPDIITSPKVTKEGNVTKKEQRKEYHSGVVGGVKHTIKTLYQNLNTSTQLLVLLIIQFRHQPFCEIR